MSRNVPDDWDLAFLVGYCFFIVAVLGLAGVFGK